MIKTGMITHVLRFDQSAKMHFILQLAVLGTQTKTCNSKLIYLSKSLTKACKTIDRQGKSEGKYILH
jgi:hypothetical protein